MPARKNFTDEDRDIALAFLDACNGDFAKAARKSGVTENILRYWQRGGSIDPLEVLFESGDILRPQPPPELSDIDRPFVTFVAAHDLETWARATFIDRDGILFNEHHEHLAAARLGFLWTSVCNTRQMRQVAGECRMPTLLTTGTWTKALYEAHLRELFRGDLPDFLITIDAPLWSEASDRRACALVEHELYHAAHKIGPYGEPMYSKSGDPIFAMRAHDVEQFIGVIERYGTQTDDERLFVAAANSRPTVADESIALACGTCGARIGVPA